jgi:hypothetical protein
MGSEKPFKNRLRLSVDLRHRRDELGEPRVDRLRLEEQRADVQSAWAPHERVFLLATLPLLRRNLRYEDGSSSTTLGLGDAELRGKVFVYQDEPSLPRHLVALTAGLKLPTAPRQTDAAGASLPPEAQPGTLSWDPLLGASYAFFARPWSTYASVQGALPTGAPSRFRASPTLRSTLALQRQLGMSLAARFGIDTRVDGKAFENGEAERDSGGWITYASPELLVSPATDLLVVLSLRLPVLARLDGFHQESLVAGLGLAWDL